MKKLFYILLIFVVACTATFIMTSCNDSEYFVDSDYIIATASLSSTHKNGLGEIEYYGIDISYESDIKLESIKYKCELYSNGEIIETFEDTVKVDGLYSKFIPLKTTKEYEHAKVTCTGWSNENPANFMRLNAKSAPEMQQCGHKNLILAKIDKLTTNNKRDYLIIHYSSNTAYGSFRLFYDAYTNINIGNAKVCLDCGYYEM